MTVTSEAANEKLKEAVRAELAARTNYERVERSYPSHEYNPNLSEALNAYRKATEAVSKEAEKYVETLRSVLENEEYL